MRFRTIYGAVIVAGIALLIVIDALLLSPARPLGTLVLAALAVLGWKELAVMAGIRGSGPKASRGLEAVGIVGVLHFFAVAWAFAPARAGGTAWLPGAEETWLTLGLAGALLASFVVAILREDFVGLYPALLETLLGVLLLGFLLSYAVRIYQLPGWEGPVWGAVFVAGVKGNDTSAYYVGKTWGRRKLLKVSPNKTLEGALGALLFSSIWFAAALAILKPPGSLFPWWGGILIGMMLSAVSQLGDLAESLLKRVYQVKDSGALLPEFGGVLDMIDSLLFTGIFFWTAVLAARGSG